MEFKDIQYKTSILYADKNASIGDYILLGKQIKDCESVLPQYVRKIKTAFLSSFTMQGFTEIFSVNAVFHNMYIDTYSAPYNQFTQEILGKESGLYKFNPDIIYIMIDAKDISGKEHIESLFNSLSANIDAKIVFFEFVTSPQKYRNTISSERVKELNTILEEVSKNYRNVSLFDFEYFLENIGKDKYWYTKFTELGDIRLAVDAFPILSEALSFYAVARAGVTKKCLVLDLDNTLWGGIVGEDGVQNIVPNADLQKYILELYKNGVLLAINSKNNEEDAFNAIDNNKDMVLKKTHFTAHKINWNDKASNMRELAKELNLGIESFVFVDDSPFEQELIRKSFPEIAVVPIDRLDTYSGFYSEGFTKEDKKRSQMYQDEKKREELKAVSTDVYEYLKTLELKVEIEEVNDNTIPRTSQLTQKTNQFNLTTRRYSEDDIKNFVKNGWKMWTLKANDKFGDYGIVGIVIIEPKGDAWRIDTFLLSCRILGRKVEEVLFGFILDNAKKEGIRSILGEFISTQKNKPSETFLPDLGFRNVLKEDNVSMYEYDVIQDFKIPDFIKLN